MIYEEEDVWSQTLIEPKVTSQWKFSLVISQKALIKAHCNLPKMKCL